MTDAALKALSGLESLKHLKVEHTQITADGVARLREALPECEIVRDDGSGNPEQADGSESSD